jgi:glycosyltransferase involved in cell wall biosynthesis
MRILMISSLFPPFVRGGAEICAHSLAIWLAGVGHDVSVLTTAPDPSQESWGEVEDGCRIYRVSLPRAYTAFDASGAPGWKKPLWHLQDLFDPRNVAVMDRVLDAVRPEFVNIQYIQGIGYNALTAIGRRGIPAVFTLHDLGLACVRMSMFVDGRECDGLCKPCHASAGVKMRYLRSMGRLGFISPSTANLEKLQAFQPVGEYPCYRVLNANEYPRPAVARRPADHVRLLYVGRLHSSKGVDVAIEALDGLDPAAGFTLDILGAGPDEAQWRTRYGDRPWIRFAGHVSLQEVADRMENSDALLVPSIWNENSPGVVIQALAQGLPVIGSAKGGIPELVEHDRNGLLVEPGDVDAWRAALAGVIADRSLLEPLREHALATAGRFAKPALSREALAVFEQIAVGSAGAARTTVRERAG